MAAEQAEQLPVDDPSKLMELLGPSNERALHAAFTSKQDAEGRIGANDVGPVLCLAGMATSDAELKPLLIDQGPSTISYVSFLVIAAKVHQLLNSRAAMVTSFKAFDAEGRGFVTAHTLRQIFQVLGDAKLSPELVDALLTVADPGDTGRVDYEALVDKIFTEYERLTQRRAVERSNGAACGAKKPAPSTAKK